MGGFSPSALLAGITAYLHRAGKAAQRINADALCGQYAKKRPGSFLITGQRMSVSSLHAHVPHHRCIQLQEIRRRLAADLPCRVVSTSLIEAGVDVDFPSVYRETAELDSILQAARRCNRESKRPARCGWRLSVQLRIALVIAFMLKTTSPSTAATMKNSCKQALRMRSI